MADRATAEEFGRATWGRRAGKTELSLGHRRWMEKLERGDLSGLEVPMENYIELRGEELASNPRATEDYRRRCLETVGLGQETSEAYAHLSPPDQELLRWVVRRGTGCMWLADSPRTSIRGFKHHLVTKGNPVRVPLHRLSREDTELVEECIRKDVARGQLKRGTSPWGAPAFVTKAPNRFKAIQRGRRLVVDYRMLNRVTVRKVFLIQIAITSNRALLGRS